MASFIIVLALTYHNKIRKYCHLLEVSRDLIFTMYVAKYLLGKAILSVSHPINSMPSKVFKFKTLMSILLRTYPLLRFSFISLKIFGCAIFVHVHAQNS